MSIKENTQNILIPSEETHLKMYPMDFEEFLWSRGNDTLMDHIRACYAERKPLGSAVHRKAMNYFREYMIVGGMPQVTKKYVETRDLKVADREKRKILALYRDDIAKHAKRYAGKVRRIFDEIPGQLSKHEKRFSRSSLGKGAKMRSYKDAFLWLDDAMIVNPCYNTTHDNFPEQVHLEVQGAERSPHCPAREGSPGQGRNDLSPPVHDTVAVTAENSFSASVIGRFPASSRRRATSSKRR